MNDHFIKNIEIKNFKCFQNFKAEGFGRVNLIGGKNNVGKTAFMEACYLSTSRDVVDLFSKYIEFATHRNGINLVYNYSTREQDIASLIDIVNPNIVVNNSGITKKTITENYEYKFIFQPFNIGREYGYSDLIQLLNRDIRNTKQCFTTQFLVASNSYPNYMFDDVISTIKRQRKHEKLNQIIKKTFGFDGIDIFQGVPHIIDYKSTIDYPLSELGQGIKSFIFYIASILISRKAYIFIDEIDTGIHYTLFDKLWEIILIVSKEQNVQVFATTHSKECIESFNRVQKELEDKETYYFEMYKNIKDNKIEMRSLEDEQLAYELSHEGRLRGE